MKFYFFTRVALKSSEVSAKIRGPLNDDEIGRYCEMWIKESSKFYEHQTVDREFRVVLRYSAFYQHVVDSFSWPDYSELTRLRPNEWLEQNAAAGPTCLSRVDADDSYSFDFMELMEQAGTEGMFLHKRIRQLNTRTGQLTKPMRHKSPMFGSLRFPHFDPAKTDWAITHRKPAWLKGVLGDHGKFHTETHCELHLPVALMRITGWNQSNRMGLMGRTWNVIEYEDKLDPRFFVCPSQ